MGAQNAKQIQGQSPVQIDHPRFENAILYQQKGNILMSSMMGLQQKDYNKWKKQISHVKLNPEYLLWPRQEQFSSKGFCGSSGTLNVSYEYFPYLLIEQIENRKKRKSKFQQCELWFLLFSLSAAQIQMKKLFDSKVGDIRPQNVFINQQGQIKVSCLHSWPNQTSNFQKTFQHLQTLLAPQDMNKLQLGGMDDPKNYSSQMFSIGMTILSASLLTSFADVYDVKKFKFRFNQADQYLQEWRQNKTYSEIFTAFISNLCSFQPEKRLTEKELWSWINIYEQQIKNKDDFVIEHAPIKIEKEIQQLRGQSNIHILQQTVSMPVGHPGQNIPFQERSAVFPFMQHPQQKIINQPQIQNMQRPVMPVYPGNIAMHSMPNGVMSPQQVHYPNIQTMVQPIHHNIQTAESMYTQIPHDVYQKQFGNLSPGVILSRNLNFSGFAGQGGQQIMNPPGQGFAPQNFNPVGVNGNFVYTRRIIDPNSNSVVAQERIGHQQYHRGIGDRNLQEQQ